MSQELAETQHTPPITLDTEECFSPGRRPDSAIPSWVDQTLQNQHASDHTIPAFQDDLEAPLSTRSYVYLVHSDNSLSRMYNKVQIYNNTKQGTKPKAIGSRRSSLLEVLNGTLVRLGEGVGAALADRARGAGGDDDAVLAVTLLDVEGSNVSVLPLPELGARVVTDVGAADTVVGAGADTRDLDVAVVADVQVGVASGDTGARGVAAKSTGEELDGASEVAGGKTEETTEDAATAATAAAATATLDRGSNDNAAAAAALGGTATLAVGTTGAGLLDVLGAGSEATTTVRRALLNGRGLEVGEAALAVVGAAVAETVVADGDVALVVLEDRALGKLNVEDVAVLELEERLAVLVTDELALAGGGEVHLLAELVAVELERSVAIDAVAGAQVDSGGRNEGGKKSNESEHCKDCRRRTVSRSGSKEGCGRVELGWA